MRIFSSHGADTYSTHGSGLECQQCERRKESIFVFFITPHRGEMSHMSCESLANPKKSSRWKGCPNFDCENYVSDEHFQFSGALFAGWQKLYGGTGAPAEKFGLRRKF